jgi:hypothetical protein
MNHEGCIDHPATPPHDPEFPFIVRGRTSGKIYGKVSDKPPAATLAGFYGGGVEVIDTTPEPTPLESFAALPLFARFTFKGADGDTRIKVDQEHYVSISGRTTPTVFHISALAGAYGPFREVTE